MKQPDLFRQPKSGAELRDEALGRFTLEERNWFVRARKRMVELYHERGGFERGAEVCSDDVWALCPPPADRHPSIMGPVFHGGMWIRTGYRASKRPSAHARVISVYTLKE